MTKTTGVYIRLEKYQKEYFERVAKQKGVPLSTAIRMAIKEHLDRTNGKPAPTVTLADSPET